MSIDRKWNQDGWQLIYSRPEPEGWWAKWWQPRKGYVTYVFGVHQYAIRYRAFLDLGVSRRDALYCAVIGVPKRLERFCWQKLREQGRAI